MEKEFLQDSHPQKLGVSPQSDQVVGFQADNFFFGISTYLFPEEIKIAKSKIGKQHHV